MAEGIAGGITKARSVRLLPHPQFTNKPYVPEEGLWFPVAPSQIGVSSSAEWNTFRVVDKGEMTNKGGRNLKVLELDTFFPSVFDGRLCQGLRSRRHFKAPETATRILEVLLDQQIIFRLLVGSDIIDMPAVLEEFTWLELSGRPYERQVSCRFKEYKAAAVDQKGKVRVPKIPDKYVLRNGEDLSDAALRIFGTLKVVPALARANPGAPNNNNVGRSAPGGTTDTPIRDGVPRRTQPTRTINIPKDKLGDWVVDTFTW